MKKICISMLCLTAAIGISSAQTNLTILIHFNGTNGSQPECDLFQGADGNLYGTMYQGGNLALNSGLGFGSVFKVTLDGQLTTLATFGYTNGAEPYGGVIQGNDGNFYGTTQFGGTNGNYGTLFQITTNSVLTPLVYFNVTNGALPYCTLLLGGDGRFYGTTASGVPGTNAGTVFAYSTNSGLTTLAAFGNSGGQTPWAGLLPGTNGLFYGTTTAGGFDGYGTVYSVSTNGSLKLVSFAYTNGFEPAAGLVQASDGNLYGVTRLGGKYNLGTLFRLSGFPTNPPPTIHLSSVGASIVLRWTNDPG